jgi:hypothetical protein
LLKLYCFRVAKKKSAYSLQYWKKIYLKVNFYS